MSDCSFTKLRSLENDVEKFDQRMKMTNFGSVFGLGKSGNYDISAKNELTRRAAATQVITAKKVYEVFLNFLS